MRCGQKHFAAIDVPLAVVVDAEKVCAQRFSRMSAMKVAGGKDPVSPS